MRTRSKAILFLIGFGALSALANQPLPVQGLGVRIKPNVLIANPGQTLAFSLELTRMNLDVPVTLDVGGLPSGCEVSIPENPVTAGNREPVIILNIPASVQTGNYVLSIKAGDVKVSADLIIQQQPTR